MQQCSNLYSTIDQIIDLVKESQLKNKDYLLYDTSNAKHDILIWTAKHFNMDFPRNSPCSTKQGKSQCF